MNLTTKKWKTREVFVKNVGIGGMNPIRIQSMTKTDTNDIEKTTNQIIKLHENGSELVRIAVIGKKEAFSLEKIASNLIKKNKNIPLVADIHFYPEAAMIVSEFVDKVRINPGNYLIADDESFLKKLHEKLLLLIDKCKKYDVAIRIGANFGSLSSRILKKFGNTKEGMVESALEYAKILRKLDFNNFLFSMKASSIPIMIQSYRLLVKKQIELGFDYPLHLGVTEAGDGIDGRLKSAIGIGQLLQDGIGDTIRVSLTEDPVREIEPARKIIQNLEKNDERKISLNFSKKFEKFYFFLEDGSFDDIDGVVDENFDFEKFQIVFLDDFYRTKLIPDKKIILKVSNIDDEIKMAVKISTMLVDRLVDGILLDKKDYLFGKNLLQASCIKKTKTEFISCPGCGRTKYDIKKVLSDVRERFENLKDMKIAVMGCVVNGPKEVSDADFGIIGSKPSMVNIYVKDKCVLKNIDEKDAAKSLEKIILKFLK